MSSYKHKVTGITRTISLAFSKRIRIADLLGGLLILSLLGFVVVYVLTLRERNRAELFLHDFLSLEPGKSSFADAQQIATVYGGHPWYTDAGDMRCTFQTCNLRFAFANRPLTSARLARYTVLFGSILIKDGVVVGREIDYARDPFWYSVIEAPTCAQVMHESECVRALEAQSR
jgi:hypothetical protein